MLLVDSLQLQFYSMGLTNSQSLTHRSSALPVLTKNYALFSLTTHTASLPRTILLKNITHQRFKEWQRTLKELQRHSEYLCLPRECIWRTSCVCSQFGEAEIQYQSGIYTLQQEMAHRLPRQEYFQESELWFMLYLIITLQFRLATNTQNSLWSIHPQSLIITPEGQMRILVQLQREIEGEGGREYVPPEEIPILLLRLIKSTDERVVMRINKSISETFQLGLTLLSAATLNDHQTLYSRSPLLALDVDRLASEIDQWREGGRYTEVMGALVANLCSFNPADRLSGPELWEWVNDHATEIRSRSAFSFRYLPRKISQLVAARIRDSQQGLLRNSRLKMEKMGKMGNSQVESRRTQMSPRSSLYEQHLYQPIHHIGKHPHHPPTPSSKYRSSFN